MSLYHMKSLNIEAEFTNSMVGKDWLEIGTSDKCGVKPNGKPYRFSAWWSENNVFQYTCYNKFSGKIRVSRYHKRRPHIFQTCKNVNARAKVGK